jgi:hypothetical protein
MARLLLMIDDDLPRRAEDYVTVERFTAGALLTPRGS